MRQLGEHQYFLEESVYGYGAAWTGHATAQAKHVI